VTEAGDTIFLENATATSFQAGPISGVYAVGNNSYVVMIKGGTGRFSNATGTLKLLGALDLNNGTVVLRYKGEICFAEPDEH
jgi:hypothetical protein